jgi:3-hydroxybutyryl-CoA dehydrogenase
VPSALVVGGGTMGSGIAQVLAQAGVSVTLSEVDDVSSKAALGRLTEGLARANDDAVLDRLDFMVGLPEAPTTFELAVEAVPENADLKRTVLAGIESVVAPTCMIVSATSSLSVDGLAAALSDPTRFLGMHFFNPVPRSALIELVVGATTRPDVLEDAKKWSETLSKECIVVRDSPGFATSRLGVVIGLEAIRMVEEDVASPEDIDRGMVLGYRFPMGPLHLTDLVGLDVRLAIAEHLERTLGERFSPPDLLRSKVARGELGKKSGQGFFKW